MPSTGYQGIEHVGQHDQLGIIAQEQRDFEQAEKWYLKSLAITATRNLTVNWAMPKHNAILSCQVPTTMFWAYHQLGMIAQEQRDFEQAEKWYLKSLEKHNTEKQGIAEQLDFARHGISTYRKTGYHFGYHHWA